MNNLVTRAITGSAYVLLTVLAAYAGTFTTMLLFFPVCLVAAWELERLQWADGSNGTNFWPIAFAGLAYLALVLGVFDSAWSIVYMASTLMLMFLIGITWMLVRAPEDAFRQVGTDALVLLLIALPLALLTHMRAIDPWLLLGFMIMLWSNDTGAYAVGRLIGRTKLLPRVSPGKTVEGFVGGVLLTMGIGWLIAQYNTFMSPAEWMVAAVIVALASTLGDLLESAFKRQAGVKDSGTLLPGHGGVLDRFDGLFLAAPALVAYYHLIH